MPGQQLVDLPVARNWLRDSRSGLRYQSCLPPWRMKPHPDSSRRRIRSVRFIKRTSVSRRGVHRGFHRRSDRRTDLEDVPAGLAAFRLVLRNRDILRSTRASDVRPANRHSLRWTMHLVYRESFPRLAAKEVSGEPTDRGGRRQTDEKRFPAGARSVSVVREFLQSGAAPEPPGI